MTNNHFGDLAAEIEAAPAPSRSLDFAIVSSFYAVYGVAGCPPYTHSVDAAMTLLDGAGYIVRITTDGPTSWCARVIGHPSGNDAVATGVTMAMAICAAAATLKGVEAKDD